VGDSFLEPLKSFDILAIYKFDYYYYYYYELSAPLNKFIAISTPPHAIAAYIL